MITAEQCRHHAHNVECIWRGKPGWDEQNNMAIEWRKAAETIERQQFDLDLIRWFFGSSCGFNKPVFRPDELPPELRSRYDRFYPSN